MGSLVVCFLYKYLKEAAELVPLLLLLVQLAKTDSRERVCRL